MVMVLKTGAFIHLSIIPLLVPLSILVACSLTTIIKRSGADSIIQFINWYFLSLPYSELQKLYDTMKDIYEHGRRILLKTSESVLSAGRVLDSR